MFKLGHLAGEEWVEHSHPPVYTIPEAGRKIIATAPGSDTSVFEHLASCIEPPYLLLYVLHTPRGEGAAGRYQSSELSKADLDRFLERFSVFLKRDSRFDLWLHSPHDHATIVWDRHNLIHAYGPVQDFESALVALGFGPGSPKIPSPHEHHYHSALDPHASALLTFLDWNHQPLRPEDEQWKDAT